MRTTSDACSSRSTSSSVTAAQRLAHTYRHAAPDCSWPGLHSRECVSHKVIASHDLALALGCVQGLTVAIEGVTAWTVHGQGQGEARQWQSNTRPAVSQQVKCEDMQCAPPSLTPASTLTASIKEHTSMLVDTQLCRVYASMTGCFRNKAKSVHWHTVFMPAGSPLQLTLQMRFPCR